MDVTLVILRERIVAGVDLSPILVIVCATLHLSISSLHPVTANIPRFNGDGDSPYESKTIIKGSPLTYICPVVGNLSSNSNSSIFFYHSKLELCLQSSSDDTLSIEHVPRNFSGTIACYIGSCDTGTAIINGVAVLLGRLRLSVCYPPTPTPTDGYMLGANDKAHCPLTGYPVPTYHFETDRTSSNDCQKTTACRACNASCQNVNIPYVQPATRQEWCQQRDLCFYQIADPRTVVILPNCFGCLMCTATNTIEGVNYTAEHRWMVNSMDLTPVCNNKITNPSVEVLPGLTFQPGRDALSITANFQGKSYYNYIIYCNGSLYTPENHNAQVTQSSSLDSCWQKVQLYWESPTPQDGGFYQIQIATEDDSVILNATVTAGSESTKICDASYCFGYGTCHELETGEQYCECAKQDQRHGKQCQYKCAGITSITSAAVEKVDRGCSFTMTIICENSLPKEDQNYIVWRKDGKDEGEAGLRTKVTLSNAIPRDTANFSCYFNGKYITSTKIQINSAPSLDPYLAYKIQEECRPCNASAAFPIVFPIDSYVFPHPVYLWSAVLSGDSDILDSSRSDCILNPNKQSLVVLQQTRCTGYYYGNASNDYGSNYTVLHVVTTGPNPVSSHRIALYVWIAAGVGGFIAFVAAFLVGGAIFYIRAKNKFSTPEQESERTSLLGNGRRDQPTVHVSSPRDFAINRAGQREMLEAPISRSQSWSTADVSEANSLPQGVIPSRPRESVVYPTYGSAQSSGSSNFPQPEVQPVESTPIHPDVGSARGRRIEDHMNVEGSLPSLNGTTDESKLCHQEVRIAFKSEHDAHPRVHLLQENTIPLVRHLAKRLTELAEVCAKLLPRELVSNLSDARCSASNRAQQFIDFWSETDPDSYWTLYKTVRALLAKDELEYVRKFDQEAAQTVGREYYLHVEPDAKAGNMSTISQAFSHEPGTPPFLARTSKLTAVSSPLDQGHTEVRRQLDYN